MLLDCSLSRLGVAHPSHLAFDKPSPKMLPFLAKHYAMVGGGDQPNKFAVFEGFYEKADEAQAGQ